MAVQVSGLKELIAKVDDTAKRHIPYAGKQAAYHTANQAREDTYRAFEAQLQMPTRYTMNSLYVRTRKGEMAAEVFLKDKSLVQKSGLATPAEVLRHLFEGGDRNFKRFEMALKKIGALPSGMAAVPGRAAPLDAHGNIPPQFIVQILAYFGAFGQEGYRANMTDKSRGAFERRQSKKAAGADVQFFISRGRGTQRDSTVWYGKGGRKERGVQHLHAGIWRRVGFGHGSALEPVIMFVKKPRYEKRFDLQQIAQAAADRVFAIEFEQAMAYALRTAR